MSPVTGTGDMSQRLLMGRAEGEALGQSLTSSDIQLTSWSTDDFIENDNSVRLTNAIIKNTNAAGMHFTGLQARFSSLRPTTINMDTTPAHATCTSSPYDCIVTWGDLPNNVSGQRPAFLFDPDAVNFTLSVAFEATLTSTRPSAYIASVSNTVWPITAVESIVWTGEGFGSGWPTTLYVDGQGVSYDTIDPWGTFIAIAPTTPTGSLKGVTSIYNGTTTLPGPYVVSGTRGYWNRRANAGDGQQTGKVYLYIWDGAGTPSNGCPPSVGTMGNYYMNIVPNVTITTANSASVIADFITVTGNSNLKIYIGFDRPSTASGLGNNDYYVYATGRSIFANTVNNLPFVGGTFSYVSQSGACP